jgi:hypothetical protein
MTLNKDNNGDTVTEDDHIFEQKKRVMLKAMHTLIPDVLSPPPEPAEWPKTRLLADLCDEDIYTARLLLLSLENKGKVLCSHRSIGNSLRWYPVSGTTDE